MSLLTRFGVSEKEVEMYVLLLQLGPQRATVVGDRLGIPRSTAQHGLERLVQRGLCTVAPEKNAFVYGAVHPSVLPNVAAIQRAEVVDEYDALIGGVKKMAPELTKMMRGQGNIPSVKFFTGKKGVREVLYDTLNSKTELLDYANIDAMFTQVRDINDAYVALREKTEIKKRSLLLDTPFARKVYESGRYSPKSHAGYKWIPAELYPFALEMNIYDGRVSYITYVQGDFTGVIIQNEHIYRMHESMWRCLWDRL